MKVEIEFDISPKDEDKFKKHFENFCVQYLAYMDSEYYEKITEIKINDSPLKYY